MVNGIFSTAMRYGEYGANFLLGTGSTVMGKKIGQAIKTRSKTGMSLPKAVGAGFKMGYNKTNAQMVASGGFFKNLGKTFKELPSNMAAGWAKGDGKNLFTKFFSKLGKAIKPLGKIMPFAMNALWLAQSIPDIIGRTKEEGILGGIKETGKALANMAVISLTASVGATFGLGGMIGLPIVASMLTGAVFGKTYGEKKAEAEAEKQAQAQPNNPFAQDKTQQGKKIDYMAG